MLPEWSSPAEAAGVVAQPAAGKIKRTYVVYRVDADVDLQHHVYHRYASCGSVAILGLPDSPGRDPDGDGGRAGNPAMIPAGITSSAGANVK